MNITIYNDGNEFLKNNFDFLNQSKFENVFFFLDAPLLKEINKENYAFEINKEEKRLVILKVEPYNALLYGDVELIETFVDFLVEHNYKFKNYLCSTKIGDRLMEIFKERNNEYFCALAMDFMTCNEKTIPSDNQVECANENDLEEIFELNKMFAIECGLLDEINKENVKKQLPNYRLIREDGKIASMAKKSKSSDEDDRISFVYTRKEYRGKGYCKAVVNTIKNEIVDDNKTATLNVDIKNPVSNHIYASIGFKKIFSQGEYRRR